MPSSRASTALGLVVFGTLSTISAATTLVNTLRDNGVENAQINTGDQYFDVASDSTPSVYVNDTVVKTYPVDEQGEYCEGFSGAYICNRLIKLTGSGGNRAHNAGSFTCGTATCSIISSRVFVESGSDLLYGGWTTAPGAASGAQLFNFTAASNGATLIGSGAHLWAGANGGNYEKDVPPGATVKFVWAIGNGSENYLRTKAAASITYQKYYTP